VENIIVGQSISEAVPISTTGAGTGVPSEAEQVLILEVRQLCDAHREALAAAESSKEEARRIHLELGKRLSEVKEGLARPGRNGGWSSLTRSVGLTRAEADGLVRRYRKTLVPQVNCGEKAIAPQPIAPEQSSAPAPASLPAADAGVCREAGEDAAASAPAVEQESQPVAEANAIAEEFLPEPVAATPAPDHASAEAGDSDVL